MPIGTNTRQSAAIDEIEKIVIFYNLDNILKQKKRVGKTIQGSDWTIPSTWVLIDNQVLH